jgi:hypothetical protein
MTLDQLATVKDWQVSHRAYHPVEYQVWDAMMTGWMLGWIGVPVALVLSPFFGSALSGLLLLLPTLYLRGRRRLHRRGLLRCDWLVAAN